MKKSKLQKEFTIKKHEVDLCVIGGGMAGLIAAVSAARKGIKVALMNDRPVLGGNASSEIRMWIRGALGDNLQETGILEEIALENIYRNPTLNFSIWDSVLYEKVRFEPNIKLFLNCSCCDIQMEENRVVMAKGWQTTTQQWHEIRAKYFADCSGDSVLAPLSGAEYRMGREGTDEFKESIQPKKPDRKTMGLSCLIQARETGRNQKFIPPAWAYKYTKENFPHRMNFSDPSAWTKDNFWWLELGGEQDSLKDTEEIRDELLKMAFGVWDFIKNSGHFESDKWELDWIGYLPGKRESRRYVGDYILKQEDVEKEGRFEDIVAYGGWSMDDHHPGGLRYTGKPTIFHPAPSPYGIPFRCLYSVNIENLFFAGRNISATHAALSSTRVMATCAIMGQAIGTASYLAVKKNFSPREVYNNCITELKNTLMEDDCFIPWNKREIPELTRHAKVKSSGGDTKSLFNGYDRTIGSEYNGWKGPLNSFIELDFGKKTDIESIRIVFDSDLNRNSWGDMDINTKRFPMRCNIPLDQKNVGVPKTLVKSFRIEAYDECKGWKVIHSQDKNYQRLVIIKKNVATLKLRLIPEETWGDEDARIFSFDVS